MKLQKSSYTRYIGVDVAKASLEIDDSTGQIAAVVDNNQQAIVDSVKTSGI